MVPHQVLQTTGKQGPQCHQSYYWMLIPQRRTQTCSSLTLASYWCPLRNLRCTDHVWNSPEETHSRKRFWPSTSRHRLVHLLLGRVLYHRTNYHLFYLSVYDRLTLSKWSKNSLSQYRTILSLTVAHLSPRRIHRYMQNSTYCREASTPCQDWFFRLFKFQLELARQLAFE